MLGASYEQVFAQAATEPKAVTTLHIPARSTVAATGGNICRLPVNPYFEAATKIAREADARWMAKQPASPS
jgi:hypothetical protein